MSGFLRRLKVFVAESDDSSSKSQQQPRHSVVESFHTAKSIQSQVKSMISDKRKSQSGNCYGEIIISYESALASVPNDLYNHLA